MSKKTVKDFYEVYRPKAKGEQRFVDKHVTIKHKDANGNGDDVFKAKNIKDVDRQPKHGYNPGEDEKVYEEKQEKMKPIKLTPGWGDKGESLRRNKGKLIKDKDEVKEEIVEAVEVKKTPLKDGTHVITVHDGNDQSFPLHPEHQSKIRDMQKGDKIKFKNETGRTIHAERTGALVHLNHDSNISNRKVAVGYHHFKEGLEQIAEGIRAYYEELGEEIDTDDLLEFADEIYESLYEEVEELEELSSNTLKSYANKVQGKIDTQSKKVRKYSDRMDRDETDGDDEDWEHNYAKGVEADHKRSKHYSMQALAKAKVAEKDAKKLRGTARAYNMSGIKIKEDVINSFIEKYVTEDVDFERLSLEDQLIEKLEPYLGESHIESFLELFRELNEDNQFQMIEHIIDEESVNDILNFIIAEKNSEDED